MEACIRQIVLTTDITELHFISRYLELYYRWRNYYYYLSTNPTLSIKTVINVSFLSSIKKIMRELRKHGDDVIINVLHLSRGRIPSVIIMIASHVKHDKRLYWALHVNLTS